MSEERYIAAIEISSSKIIAAVGKTYGEGHLEVIAIEQEKGVDTVRYGIIQNLEETSVKVARIIDRLERRTGVAPRQVKGLFVGLSGRSLRSIPTDVHLNLPEDTEITDEILARLRNEAMRSAIDNSLEVVDVVPRLYQVGKTETHSPKGNIGNFIQATYDLIVCRPELKRNLSRTIPDKLRIRIDGFVVTALATGHLILTADEKRLGCMLVDIGAETTTVTIYRKGCLAYFATLPLGGRNITRDITSLNVLEENAEDIKITSGNAIPRETPSSLNLNGVKHSDVSNLVVARSEEIVANIVEQMEYEGLKETDLPGGIVVIGGGARLQGMTDLLSQQSNLAGRRGKMPSYVSFDDTMASGHDTEEIVSVMYAGATLSNVECLQEPERQELPATGSPLPPEEPEVEIVERRPKKQNKFLTGFKSRIAGLFGGPAEDNSDLIE
ncbi:MAG: cell division protein FtsA [Muribaculaceae bacterium]|nr:cell division protein FtsA [Muribaculaceae bacterium]